MSLEVIDYPDGTIIYGEFLDPAVQEVVREQKYALALFDPPYGNVLIPKVVGTNNAVTWDRFDGSDTEFVDWMMYWTKLIAEVLVGGGAFCCWGGVGFPGFRPFYKYLPTVEEQTAFKLAAHITWGKKRAYGVRTNFLFTREECAYFVLGDPKKPRVFNVPYLEQKRGYEGYNKDHPALDERLRRTMVWSDITEIFKGKTHEAQKPVKTYNVLIETCTNPGETVLDGFAGSGTTAICSIALKRRFVCVEKYKAEFANMRRRIDYAYEKNYYGDTPSFSDANP